MSNCACCHRPWGEIPTFSRPRERGLPEIDKYSVCNECKPHAGHHMQMNTEHVKAWEALTERLRAEHAAQLSQLRVEIAQVRQELVSRPEKIVDRYIEADVLEAAQNEAQRAFRSRENAWQALTEVRLLHRETDDVKCRCGVRIDRCAVAKIVERYPGLRRWEEEQVSRLRRGEPHALPDAHPAVLDRRWLLPGEYDDDSVAAGTGD